ncbi:hypothetical protein [Micromonospora sp. DT233]|uniref:hypothetical protein n=1 Tax=Micromonospora sp. DT233 TaxID=3393432 RepID=UPI003CF7910D
MGTDLRGMNRPGGVGPLPLGLVEYSLTGGLGLRVLDRLPDTILWRLPVLAHGKALLTSPDPGGGGRNPSGSRRLAQAATCT